MFKINVDRDDAEATRVDAVGRLVAGDDGAAREAVVDEEVIGLQRSRSTLGTRYFKCGAGR